MNLRGTREKEQIGTRDDQIEPCLARFSKIVDRYRYVERGREFFRACRPLESKKRVVSREKVHPRRCSPRMENGVFHESNLAPSRTSMIGDARRSDDRCSGRETGNTREPRTTKRRTRTRRRETVRINVRETTSFRERDFARFLREIVIRGMLIDTPSGSENVSSC